MSIVVETLLFCDGRSQGCTCQMTAPYADGDSKSDSAKEQRNSAKAEGWSRRNGKDYCPDCTDQIKNTTLNRIRYR